MYWDKHERHFHYNFLSYSQDNPARHRPETLTLHYNPESQGYDISVNDELIGSIDVNTPAEFEAFQMALNQILHTYEYEIKSLRPPLRFWADPSLF
jgi:hypothetical protein